MRRKKIREKERGKKSIGCGMPHPKSNTETDMSKNADTANFMIMKTQTGQPGNMLIS